MVTRVVRCHHITRVKTQLATCTYGIPIPCMGAISSAVSWQMTPLPPYPTIDLTKLSNNPFAELGLPPAPCRRHEMGI
ncbi:unnamed protein product [Protopolystoma xenopodis]|uniref:Uncharacterized protein n=1 Tax=Protopolystoma xenopodis TaxID=117903 RepID=A0A3S4ZK03_9PLAT|nr:unnamed protein product [Protopolystoma xenopodis]